MNDYSNQHIRLDQKLRHRERNRDEGGALFRRCNILVLGGCDGLSCCDSDMGLAGAVAEAKEDGKASESSRSSRPTLQA